MVTSKNSPKRRRSIAVTNQNKPAAASKPRRRAHSIAPGAALSPSSKARRSLAPRKSILKAAANTLNVETSSQDSTSQALAYDDTNATRSMDLTQDFTALVHDNTSRKSFGRRVSFASHSHVRMFDTNHTNSTGSPQSSRGSTPSSSPEAPAQIHDENDYPGHGPNHRRNSVRFSLAQSEDMDLTMVIPSTFQTRGSAILDEELDGDEDDDYDDDNMDVTEAIHGNLARKRSLSMGGRQPLSQIELTIPQSEEGAELSSEIGNDSVQSVAESEQSQAMEFTIPLGQSLRPPPEQDEAWLALKSITHSGSAPAEPETSFDQGEMLDDGSGMNLDNAMERLRRARDSMSLANPPSTESQFQDDSFTSTEDSFGDDNLNGNGNKTLNLSRILGRVSTGNGPTTRMSMGQDSNMDESEVYGSIVPAAATQTPRTSILPTLGDSQPERAQKVSKPAVFHPPPSSTLLTTMTTTTAKTSMSEPMTVASKASPSKTSAPDTPSKVKPKPTFSAAFAPPVARPSPKRPTSRPSMLQSPAKRPRSESDDIGNRDADRPSPAKRQALVRNWVGDADTTAEEQVGTPLTLHKPKPLSPSKKAPFQAAAASESQPPSALRRPSGYFAKRKSLAVSFANPTTHDGENSTITTAPPRKQAGIGLGRASLGSGPSDAWTRFNKDSSAGGSNKTSLVASEKEKEAAACVREAARQAIAVPSPTRGSPAPYRQVVDVSLVENVQSHPLSPRPLTDALNAPVENDEVSGEIDMHMEATKNWRQGVEQHEAEDDDTPVISIAQFFSMTGIKFMDELTAPRRSIHPSQQPIRQARNTSEIPLAEYVTAMAIDVPQLDLYSRVSRDLEAWMEKSKDVFTEAEDEASKVTPELFVEYAKADEESQAELLHQLNLIRTHTRYLAKSDWYDWKLKWVEGLRATADEAFQSLESDARSLEELKKSADVLIPELEREYEQLRLELEAERAEVEEIEASDQDYLNELKATIAEQNIVVEALEAELTEGKEQLRWLSEKKEELAAQKRDVKNTIANAERILHMKQSSTRSEVFRLKDELEALQDLHIFRITKVNSTLFEYTYASRFHVCIPCRNFLPVISKVNISRIQKSITKYKDHFPQLTVFLLSSASRLITDGDEDLTVRQIVHRLNDYWSSCAQLRTQLTMLNIKYPVEIIGPASNAPIFKAKAMVMLPKVLGKIYVSFVFSFNTFSRWPIAIDTLDCEVEVAYGDVDRSTIMKAVMSRLSEASPAENYACLLDACIEAQGLYH